MAPFHSLIRFESAIDGQTYFADVGIGDIESARPGLQLEGYVSIEDLIARNGGEPVTVGKGSDQNSADPCAGSPNRTGIPLYCIGLNYKSHAEEAKRPVTEHPSLWTKPAASLANPDEDIVISKFCAASLPDYEGELVFVTSRDCRDVGPDEAESYILGYTIGNDISCRLFQLPEKAGGQFFFAKAFDKFAPIGPALIHPDVFKQGEGLGIITRLNGQIVQEAKFAEDLVWKPAELLIWMSRSTTIPTGTAVMTGTPAGVGIFRQPRRLLSDGDIVEVEVPTLGTLKNKIIFE